MSVMPWGTTPRYHGSAPISRTSRRISPMITELSADPFPVGSPTGSASRKNDGIMPVFDDVHLGFRRSAVVEIRVCRLCLFRISISSYMRRRWARDARVRATSGCSRPSGTTSRIATRTTLPSGSRRARLRACVGTNWGRSACQGPGVALSGGWYHGPSSVAGGGGGRSGAPRVGLRLGAGTGGSAARAAASATLQASTLSSGMTRESCL